MENLVKEILKRQLQFNPHYDDITDLINEDELTELLQEIVRLNNWCYSCLKLAIDKNGYKCYTCYSKKQNS